MRTKSGLAVAAVVGAVMLATAAGASPRMNAEQFYLEAVKLEKKGAMALLSMGKVKALMREVEGAADVAKADHKAREASGRPTRFCPPKSKSSIDSNELMSELRRIPQAERKRIDMAEVMTRVFARKYPCPAKS